MSQADIQQNNSTAVESSTWDSASSSSSSSPPSISPALSRTSSYTGSSTAATSEDDLPKQVIKPNRNPHLPPDFSARTQDPDAEPILYLPPLISSLPTSYPPHYVPPPQPTSGPLTTDARLPSIDPASLALHKALHAFRPQNAEYAATAYAEAFNWEDLTMPEEVEGQWYCVCFRSKRKAGSDSGPLYAADQKAHEEAVSNGGLLMYWYGVPHPQSGVNLATCIWQSRDHARAANGRPHHITAMRLAATSYEMYDLERYTLRKNIGKTYLEVENYREDLSVGRRA